MKNGTNIFFLVLAGGAAIWAWNEYNKQRAAQQRMFAEQGGQLGQYGYSSPYVVDYAERLAAERDLYGV